MFGCDRKKRSCFSSVLSPGILKRKALKESSLVNDSVLMRWEAESRPLPQPWPKEGDVFPVQRVMGNPAWAKLRIAWEIAHQIRTADDKY
jgi:hypothetical protein